MLGGHMRCHMAKNLLEREPPLAINTNSKEERRVGYCLRENPKKSWKLLGLKENAQENACPVCDKRFMSMRAMFRHMNIHSRKEDERGDQCEDRGKGSSLKKSFGDHKRTIHDKESLFNKGHFMGSSKTKSDLLLFVLSDDETMRVTRRKRTPRIAYDIDDQSEGVLSSIPKGSSDSSEAKQDLEGVAPVTLMMMIHGKTHFNSSRLGVRPSAKSSASYFLHMGKGRITDASKRNSHSRGYSRMERKGVELEIPAGKLRRAREVEQKKLKQARSGEELVCEVAMMDRDAMGTAGSNSKERAELWLGQGLNSHRDKVRSEVSQAVQEPIEENKHKSRDAESYKQEAPVDASHGIEGSRGCTELKSTKHDFKKMSCARSDNGDAPDTSI